jgi:hypothetical protein
MSTFGKLVLFAFAASCGGETECVTNLCDQTNTMQTYSSCTADNGDVTFTYGTASCSCNSATSGPGDCSACATKIALFCQPPATAAPYESCATGDTCTEGTACLTTTLPANAGFTGSLCTTACTADADCLQDLSSFTATCVNDQCYITCPSGGITCPYGTACLTFTDATTSTTIDICTP